MPFQCTVVLSANHHASFYWNQQSKHINGCQHCASDQGIFNLFAYPLGSKSNGKKACVLREMETSSCARPSGPGPIIRSQAGSTGWDKQQGLTPYVGPCSCSPHGSSSKGSGDWGLVNHSSNYCTAWDALN
jgi:hypothetical protein